MPQQESKEFRQSLDTFKKLPVESGGEFEKTRKAIDGRLEKDTGILFMFVCVMSVMTVYFFIDTYGH